MSIELRIERHSDCVLVSSPQFPLLHLAIPSGTPHEIEDVVLPVLREMVKFETGGQAILRLVSVFFVDDGAPSPPEPRHKTGTQPA